MFLVFNNNNIQYTDSGLFLVVLIEQTNFGFDSTKIRFETAEILKKCRTAECGAECVPKVVFR